MVYIINSSQELSTIPTQAGLNLYWCGNENKIYIRNYAGCKDEIRITVGEFVDTHPQGTYLITMRGHITCAIDGCIYDTFDPSDRFV